MKVLKPSFVMGALGAVTGVVPAAPFGRTSDACHASHERSRKE